VFGFRSSDQRDNLRGEGLDLLLLDEAAYQPEEVWTDVLRPMLADRRGRAVFASTPQREGDWFQAAFDRGQRGEDGGKSWQLPSVKNPRLDPQEIEDARQQMPGIVFRREFGAEFVSAAGALIKREWLRYGEPPPGLSVVLGVDLAISEKTTADWTAVV